MSKSEFCRSACFILRGHDTHIDFLRLLFLVGVIYPLMKEHSLRLKKLIISQAPEDAMLKIKRPVYKRLFTVFIRISAQPRISAHLE